MDYEELLSSVRTNEKDLAEQAKSQQKLLKNIQKSIERGDIKSWIRDMQQLRDVCDKYSKSLQQMKEQAENFEAREYIDNGDFAAQLVEYCERIGLDIKGDFPSYEVFPYRVKVDTESLDLFVDRKKVQSFRPQSFANDLKIARDKLNAVSFNALAFANELAEAYDTALVCQSKGSQNTKDIDCSLATLYKYLAPMGRYRKEYDRQSYAFDVARLFSADLENIKDGRRFQFGPGRSNDKTIRILDKDGNEHYFATIRFFV